MAAPPTQGLRVVVATERTSLAGGGDRLLRLVRWLQRSAVDVEILALAEGDDLAAFSAVAHTTVLRRLLGPAEQVGTLIGGSRAAQGLRGRALRRWLSSRSDARFVVHHPVAASVLRYSPVRPRHVAMLPTPSWSLADLRPRDLETLSDAAGWLVCEQDQVAQVTTQLDADAIEQGSLLDIDELPTVTRAEQNGTVVLLPTAESWESVNHTVEVAWVLRTAAPGHDIVWVVDGPDDRWLADHDRRSAALDDRVRLVSSRDPRALVGLGAVVRTGYGPSPSALTLAARVAGVPVLGFAAADVSPPLEPVAVLDVDALVSKTLEVIRPGGASAAGVGPFAGFGPEPRAVVRQLVSWLSPNALTVT